MAYLDDFADATETQRRSQANNPVIPNSPPPGFNPNDRAGPADAYASPQTSYGDPGSGLSIGTYDTPQVNGGSTLNRFISDPLGTLNNAVRPDSPSAQSYRAQNAIVDPSVLEPRRALYVPPTPITPLTNTPIANAVAAAPAQPYLTTPDAPAGGVATRPSYLDEYAAMQARDRADQQEADNRQRGVAQAASAQTDLMRLQGEQRVARWNAQNGADVILGSDADKDRASAIAQKNLADVNADVAAAQGRLAAGNAAQQGNRNYVDEYAKIEAAKGVGERTAALTEDERANAAVKRQTVVSQQQIQALRDQLANEKDPAKAKVLEDKLLAMQGHRAEQDRVAVVDVDTGQKDMLGQPIYKKAAINVRTGEFLGGQGQAKADPTAQLKALSPDQALTYAKRAIAAGYSRDDVNKMLKAAGHKEI